MHTMLSFHLRILDQRISLPLAACFLAGALGGCHHQVAAPHATPARSAPTVASRPPPPEIPELTIPSDLELSPKGREAIQILARAERFGGAAVGYAGSPVPEVAALRALVSAKNAARARLLVVDQGTLPAQLMARCGLYYADHAEFAQRLSSYRSRTELVSVRSDGCIDAKQNMSVRDLVSQPGAIKLSGPLDTLSDW